MSKHSDDMPGLIVVNGGKKCPPEEYRKNEGIDWLQVHFVDESRAPVIIAGVGLLIG